MPSESSDLRRLLRAQNHEIAILHTGVGAKCCRARLEPFLAAQRFDFLISSGFAGSLAPSLGAGDLVLAENFSNPQLLEQASSLLITQVGKLASAAKVIENAAERASFARETKAVAVDMETATIAQMCAARQLPMLSLRVVSDSAAAPLPAPASVLFDLDRQKTHAGRLANYLLRHPGALVRLWRFSREVKQARARLTSALAILARELER